MPNAHARAVSDYRTKPVDDLTRGEKVCRFIEHYCRVPEGALVGQPVRLAPFQSEFICAIYDNPGGTRRAYLSIARKNGKSALIAGILLAHLCGPEAKTNSQIVSGAMSRDQAALVHGLAAKMVQLNPELTGLVRVVPSSKRLIGLKRNVEYRALSADGQTAHGLSPVLAILDEVGQIRGPQSDFVDAMVTSQGAHDAPLLVAISTQAPNENDLLSIWLDDAVKSKDQRIVSHVYAAPEDADLMDEQAWKAANPALGLFRSLEDVREQAERAKRMPSFESTFRNLILNQKVEAASPFITRSVWEANAGEPDFGVFRSHPTWVGIDLSARNDLTAMVLVSIADGIWHCEAHFWAPADGLRDRSKRDRAPYDVWESQGFIHAVPGASVDYEVVARDIAERLSDVNVVGVAFDRWRFDLLVKELAAIGVELPLVPFGQGFRDMAPAIDIVETALLNSQMRHGAHPVLTMCMANCRIEMDAAGNRKLNKAKSTGRIDGAVALAMAMGVAGKAVEDQGDFDGFISSPVRLG